MSPGIPSDNLRGVEAHRLVVQQSGVELSGIVVFEPGGLVGQESEAAGMALAETEQRDVLEIIEDRYQLGATIVASQCPIGEWHPNLGDPTLADAVCDRLLHNAYRIELRGDSMRTRPESTSQNERKEALVNDNKNELD